MITVHAGREIEIIKPKNPHGQCAYTVNGQGPRDGERFTADYGTSAADVLAELKRQIDDLDARGPEGITGTPEWTWMFRPGSWEVCPAPGLNSHIKPAGAPCNEDWCRREAKKKAAAARRRAEKHPAPGAMVTKLEKAGFCRAEDGRDSEGFRVHRGDLAEIRRDHRKGVTIVWHARGYLVVSDDRAGRCPEIAEFLIKDGTYAVHYEGGARIRVVSKTHGVL